MLLSTSLIDHYAVGGSGSGVDSTTGADSLVAGAASAGVASTGAVAATACDLYALNGTLGLALHAVGLNFFCHGRFPPVFFPWNVSTIKPLHAKRHDIQSTMPIHTAQGAPLVCGYVLFSSGDSC